MNEVRRIAYIHIHTGFIFQVFVVKIKCLSTRAQETKSK